MVTTQESSSGTRTTRRGRPATSVSSMPSRSSLSRQSSRNTQDLSDSEPHSSSSTRRTATSKVPSRRGSRRRELSAAESADEDQDEVSDDAIEDDDEDEDEDLKAETEEEDGESELEPGKDQGDGEENEGEVDEAGETKITKDGELLGGRQFKCRTFKVPDRGDRVYMLSMDPARVLGFRDSYLFFIKNPHLIRVITTAEERTWMIREGLLMANFKSKLIALVTARSIFKTFGHRIIKNGRSRVDDYYEAAAEDDPMDSYDREASTQVEEGSVGTAGDDIGSSRRKRALDQFEETARPITGLNWMYESALTVRALNTQLKTQRKENPRFLDPHTNIEQIPAALQPTRCVVKVAPDTVDRKPVIRRRPSLNTEGSNATEVAGPTPLVSKVAAVPRSIGPKIDTNVKIEIKASAPGPPIINDPRVWAAIPEDIRKAIEEAEASPAEDEEDPDQFRFPISLMSGHYQSTYPVHQVRIGHPYRLVLPQSMVGGAQQIHQLWTTQGLQGALKEQSDYPGNITSEDLRLLQAHQEQVKQQQLQQQQKELAQKQHQAQLQQQQLQQAQAAGICGECYSVVAPDDAIPSDKPLPCSTAHLNKCKACANSFHPICIQLDTPRIVSAIGSYPWQCNDCKLCVVCLEAGDEATLLICDDCDRGWHMGCCDPAIKDVPQGDWLCSFCAQCHSCKGSEAPATTYHHATTGVTATNKYPTYICTYCTVCFDNFNKDRFCPVCLRTYRGDIGDEESGDEDDNNMVCCDECNRWVHMECDGQLTEAKVDEMGKDESLKYTCPVCLNRTGLLPGIASTDLDPTEATLSMQGGMAPQPKACGLLEATPVRGMLMHKGKKLGVPVIVGTGVEYDRKLVAELLERRSTVKSRKRSQRQAAIERALGPSTGVASSSTSKNQKSRSPAKRRVSVASSTSSLSSVSYISDN
ncbi:PHD finger protein 10 [Haplosporangium bisporale]|nr:PHD finger protein 10 [Haplosporangium bisporale]